MALSDGEIDALGERLRSKLKLDRDRACDELSAHIQNGYLSAERLGHLINELCSIIVDPKASHEADVVGSTTGNWERRHGALSALVVIDRVASLSASVCVTLFGPCLRALQDDEVRIRMAAGELLGRICRSLSGADVIRCRSRVMQLIRDHMERPASCDNGGSAPSSPMGIHPAHGPEASSGPSSAAKLERRFSASEKTELLHDTAGWRILESSVKCLQHVIECLGADVVALHFVDDEMLQLIESTDQHTNRFVRETTQHTTGAIVRALRSSPESVEANYNRWAPQLVRVISSGLSDNWSQVRYAASIACRSFFIDIAGESDTLRRPNDGYELYYSELLPPMCLNRYYVAEGVKQYSIDTWRLLFGEHGRDMVHAHIDEVLRYYLAQTGADNHAVREAACHCLAEVAAKLDPSAVRPYIERLLQALLRCFDDESWPVRDTACTASGTFIRNYSQDCKFVLSDIYERVLSNLGDAIPSVRDGAAATLAIIVQTYDAAVVLSELQPRLIAALHALADQPASSSHHIVSYEPAMNAFSEHSGPGVFGVVRRVTGVDDRAVDQTMYSCGSFAPKMRRPAGTQRIAPFARPSSDNQTTLSERRIAANAEFDMTDDLPSAHNNVELWHAADGVLVLLMEISRLVPPSMPGVPPDADNALKRFLNQMAASVVESARLRHYAMHVNYLQTLLRLLPPLASAIGKREFKNTLLEPMFEPIFYALQHDNYALANQARDCLDQLARLIGPSILRARVEMCNSDWATLMTSPTAAIADHFDRAMPGMAPQSRDTAGAIP